MAATDDREFDEIDHEADDLDVEDSGAPAPPQAPPPAPGTPAVIADDVHVKYRVFGGRQSTAGEMGRLRRLVNRSRAHVGAVTEVHAVRGVSFVARHGESVGLIGMNGAGKSTLLRAVAGLMPISEGRVFVDGTTALLGVNAALVPALTGARNVMIGGLALGLTPDQVRERFDDIVEFAGIGDFINLPMKAYSSGMAARLRFAISTAAIPDILMIDEALATGDAAFRNRSRAKIEEIREHAGTVFLVSHSTQSIERMCDRAIWLDQGRMLADGPAREVVAEYRKALQKKS
ncbi:ABC transporter ATP-binding protein [Ruania alba]|uniref:Teichoic acid transport system ATP-binding protein n=1 Tax=Ruania alba TaxID=648782 RepID=A0A1H5NCD5_9MICO|nr:ABC transporter ATP-binding protein [Ruania alba]SEE98541.1 teichoic acid transport system ATP-binding protein [Ruania alba]